MRNNKATKIIYSPHLGHTSEPVEAGNRASKAFDKVADDFYVDEDCHATYKGIKMMSSLGPCTSTLKGKIS